MNITANGIRIEVEDQGPPDAPAVLLIMGLGMQLIAWPPYFVQPLLDAGYRVIRFDNRDIGLSQYFDELGPPNLPWALARLPLGLPVKPPTPCTTWRSTPWACSTRWACARPMWSASAWVA